MLLSRMLIVAVSLFLLGSCAKKPLRIELQNPDFYNTVNTIGVYINPTGNQEYDQILLNAIHLRCIAAGYDVVNVVRSPNQSNPIDPANKISGSHQSHVKTIQRELMQGKIRPDGSEAFFVVSPKWKSFDVILENSKNKKLYRSKSQSFTLSVTTLDVSTGNVVASGTFSDSTEQYLSSATVERLQYDRHAEEIEYFLKPANVLIKNCVERALRENPIPKATTTVHVDHKFPVTFYVDEKYRQLFPNNWQDLLSRRLLYATDIFNKQFGAGFYIKAFKKWHTADIKSLDKLMERLMQRSGRVNDEFIIGVTFDKSLAESWTDYHMLGLSMAWGNHIVIKDIPSFQETRSWDAIDEALLLVHELGHAFGTPHVYDKHSIMYPLATGMNYKFDSFNRDLLKVSIPAKFKKDTEASYIHLIDKLIDNYKNSDQKNIEFVSMMNVLLSEYYLKNKGLNQFKLASKNFYVADSGLAHAITGYRYFLAAEWQKSLAAFEKAENSNWGTPEVYDYCRKIYEKLGNKEKSVYYQNLVKDKGFYIAGLPQKIE